MKKGTFSAFIAYAMWGVFPLYFRLLHAVPAFQTMTHRVVWSFVFLILIVILRGEIKPFLKSITPKLFGLYLVSGVLIALNWLTYVWAVAQGYVLESSLGYFINPLVSVVLGVVFLHEKLRPAQWIPVGLAAIGVLYLTISYGKLPWISLALALTFGFYGLVKKLSPLNSLHGLALETGTIFIPALLYLSVMEFTGAGVFGHSSGSISILLVLTGIVTAIPLILFAIGAQTVPLNTLGLLQYINPTMQFICGVFLFGEPFSHTQLIGFVITWAALIFFTVENFIHYKQVTAPMG
jgi:chloramphenicol-sensitive protein RarD